MGLENLKSIFAEGVGNNATSPEGRHGADTGKLVGQLPNDYSQLDNFSPFMSTFKINSNSSIAELFKLEGQFIGFNIFELFTYISAVSSPL